MRIPSAQNLLLAWEDGCGQSPTRRALALLAAALPAVAAGELAALPVGRRDARLFRVRRALFGEHMAALAQCPACDERLDVSFGIGDVCADGAEDDGGAAAPYSLRLDGYDIGYRLPTSADLLALAAPGEGDAAHMALLRCCIDAALHHGAPVAVEQLPAAVVQAVSEAMAQADPQARIELALDCPACGHAWFNLLDIAGFLWSEVDAWARRTLHDVHTLARAYGWSEAEILALTPRRRELYLDMVRR